MPRIKVYHVNKSHLNPCFEDGKPTNLVSFDGELPEPVSDAALESCLESERRRICRLNLAACLFLGLLFAALVLACINAF